MNLYDLTLKASCVLFDFIFFLPISMRFEKGKFENPGHIVVMEEGKGKNIVVGGSH